MGIIDVLVAEKVMGWRVAHFPTINIYEAYDEEENPIIIGKDFSPARKIQDAWMVVENLKKFGLEIAIYTDTGTTTCHVTDAPSSLMTTWESEAETAPLAICLAALKAVGVEVEVEG